MKKTIVIVMVLAASGLLAATANAGTIDASAVITAKADGADFDYTITLTNTSGAGNDSIATFWFAWVPGADFLATTPISVTNPMNWTDVLTHFPNTPSNGVAIQFDTTLADALAPGGTEVFQFKSVDTPAEVAGKSVFYPTTPVLTSFVYSQGPLQGDGHEFVVNGASLPEPSSLVLGAIGVAGSLVCWRRRRRATA